MYIQYKSYDKLNYSFKVQFLYPHRKCRKNILLKGIKLKIYARVCCSLKKKLKSDHVVICNEFKFKAKCFQNSFHLYMQIAVSVYWNNYPIDRSFDFSIENCNLHRFFFNLLIPRVDKICGARKRVSITFLSLLLKHFTGSV